MEYKSVKPHEASLIRLCIDFKVGSRGGGGGDGVGERDILRRRDKIH